MQQVKRLLETVHVKCTIWIGPSQHETVHSKASAHTYIVCSLTYVYFNFFRFTEYICAQSDWIEWAISNVNWMHSTHTHTHSTRNMKEKHIHLYFIHFLRTSSLLLSCRWFCQHVHCNLWQFKFDFNLSISNKRMFNFVIWKPYKMKTIDLFVQLIFTF